ncbi:MAG: glycosyltransferase family 4 protein [Candidatus Roizmanbacteria bacterium]|nr:glycosyltransferase family 4 protein [Candidatus Roizmanbacteria bacterium]
MKILFITSTSSAYIGGEAVYLENLLSALEERGIEVRVIVLSTINKIVSNYSDDPRIRMILVKDLYTYTGLLARNMFYPYVYYKLRKEVREFNPTVVHLQTVFYLKTVLLCLRNLPIIQSFNELSLVYPLFPVFFEHDPYTTYRGEIDFKQMKKNGIKKRTVFIDHLLCSEQRFSKKYVRTFLCPSQYLLNEAHHAGFKNTLYLPYFQEDSTPYIKKEASKNPPYLLFVGRLEKIKGVDNLLHAFVQIHKERPDVQLRIIGIGPLSESWQDLAHQLDIDTHVQFFGWVQKEKVFEYYQEARAVIIPSIYPETNPLVAFEAMRQGTPVIAYNVGGLPETVEHEYSGLVVKRFDIPGLAQACIRLIDDASLAHRFGTNGRNRLTERYSKKGHIDALIQIYDSLI